MNSKLLILEGIPGSGKSTMAKRASESLAARHIPNRLYNEGSLHPADLAWCACVPLGELDDICAQYPAYAAAIRANMTVEAGYAIVAYVAFPIDRRDAALYDLLAGYELYDGRCPDTLFERLHRVRWASFARAAVIKEEVNVFECALMQNHVNEYMLFRNRPEAAIRLHIGALLASTQDLNPLLIYLHPTDVNAAIRHVAEERGGDVHGQSWAERVSELIESSPYGRANRLAGFDGMVQYFVNRQAMELRMLPTLPVRYRIIENDAKHWEDVWRQLKDALYEG